jgi:predicted nucleotidyltransferase
MSHAHTWVSDHVAMEIRPGVQVDDNALASFAERHAIRRLAVFGSVLRDDFRPDSDVDVLVEFERGAAPGLLGIASMELELGGLIGREVELRTYGDLSRFFRDRVRGVARELYAA